MRIELAGPSLSVQTCAARLEGLIGASVIDAERRGREEGHGMANVLLEHAAGPDRDEDLECRVAWHGPGHAPDRPGSEAMIQATCGLAHLHGLERGCPRRIGLEIASVAAGLLASQGVLASLIAGERGGAAVPVRTSVTQAALLSISQYIARSTSSDTWSEWLPVPPGPDPGPPFTSADGHGFEIETLDAEAWKRFWLALGVDGSLLAQGWTLFNARYSTARCTLPEGFHGATRRRQLAEVAELAISCGLSFCRVRGSSEVLLDPGIGTVELPAITPLTVDSGEPALSSAVADRLAKSRPDSRRTLPLSGFEVVEATARIQGPLAGQLLRMLGAEVIRVEPPGGDPARMSAPLAGTTGALFECMNRGKDPVEIDLRRPEGRATLRDLITQADVFLHNWRPGKAGEWGLDASDCARRNAQLVYCAASGWGRVADKCPPIGMEFQVQAYTGLGHAINPEGEPPFPTRLLVSDFMGAMVACEGTLAGLYQRERTKSGCHVDSSLLAGAMTLQAHVFKALNSGQEHGRRRGRPLWGDLDVPLPTADGHVMLTADDEEACRQLREVCASVDRRGVDDPLAERLTQRSGREWQEAFLEAGLPCGVVRTDFNEFPYVHDLDGCLEALGGKAWAPASPWRFGAH